MFDFRPQQPQTVYGMQVVVAPLVPKLQLSEDVPLTPEFRSEFNKWMAEFFGYQCVVPEGYFNIVDGTAVVHPHDFDHMKHYINTVSFLNGRACDGNRNSARQSPG